MNIQQAIENASNELIYSCERPKFEAELLMMHHLKCDRTHLILHSNETLDNPKAYQNLVSRRAAHEPMEYITNSVSFYDTVLYVDSGALIPRPETEILIDKVSQIMQKEKFKNIAEIGLGSGAISIVLARKFPDVSIVASDISADALKVARKNINDFGLEEQIKMVRTSLLDGIDSDIDLIVSNPPYIAKNTPLAPNVAEYEPHTALFSDENGDELLKEIILLGRERGVKYLACEMGYDQKDSISSYADTLGINEIKFYKDYANLDRGFIIKY